MSGKRQRRSAGHPATQPPVGWRPPARRDGLRVQFVSEDGTQRKLYDFSTLPGRPQLAQDLAVAFDEATGPLGSWKRVKGADSLFQSARQASRWLTDNRPSLTSLAQLSAADARLLALSFRVPSGDGLTATLRALLRYSPVVTLEAQDALLRIRRDRRRNARQPYTAEEFRRICVVARGIVRKARERLDRHWDLVAEYRAGAFDQRPPTDPQRCLAQALDHCARLGDIPRTRSGAPTAAARRAMDAAGGQALLPLLHLSTGEAWAFAVLLAGLTGLNPSVLSELPAPHLHATAPGEPGIALIDAHKPRRGRRSAMTLPLTALPPQLRPTESGDPRRRHVLNTSLTTAFGVFSLLITLTEPGRQQLNTRHAFIYCTVPLTVGNPRLKPSLPTFTGRATRSAWVREWLTGDQQHDQLLIGISLDRLRKTYLEQVRKPVAHTPATLARYLSRMDVVTTEGFQIVREALDAQVADALTRRKMTLGHTEPPGAEPPAPTAQDTAKDTVLGACADFEHSPYDDGRRCRQSFLTCLDCANARAFPRHLPLQLLVLDHLKAHQQRVPLHRWIEEFAGRVAQLEDLLAEYEPAQLEQGRNHITAEHHHLVARLFSGDLDPL